jgi:plasmid stabilization system protein ParE
VARASRTWEEGRAAQGVPHVVYSRNALSNLERAFEFLAQKTPEAAEAAAEAIQSAIETLGGHPLIGRRVRGDLRESVISFRKTGYVALYRFIPARDEVRVLALRHQRELDYRI